MVWHNYQHAISMLNCPSGVHRIVLSLVIAVCGKSLAKRCDASRFCFKEAKHQRRTRHQLENSCGNHLASLTVRQSHLLACPPTKFFFFFPQPLGHFCRFAHETNLVNVILRQEPWTHSSIRILSEFIGRDHDCVFITASVHLGFYL